MGNLLRKICLEIAVNDSFVNSALTQSYSGGKSGEVGDGKIFIYELEECIRIRTEEQGSTAIG
jgi:nitrogen regulatory protein P-II 1